jgi:predicted Rossmann fold nucleotide-binding protein DprA/Smf involved in DNA uptake
MLKFLAPDEPQHIEQLISRAGFAPERVAALLVTLELGGWARQLAGQRWVSLETRARRT